MTDDEHRMIGRLLGYPSCCVEAFIDGTAFGARDGVVVERMRTEGEARKLARVASKRLGRTWPRSPSSVHDLRKAYVPCPAHVGTEGWQP